MTNLAVPRPHVRPAGPSALRIGAWLAAGLAILPLLAIVWLALTRPSATAMPLSLILQYGLTTAALGGLTAVAVTVLGTSAAWLVVMYRFPGRSLFSWALALP